MASQFGANQTTKSDQEWLAEMFASWTDDLPIELPSDLAERIRYLPKSVTPLPGYFRFEVCPYWREVLDCISLDSPVRVVVVRKGAQLCYTVAVLENAILYWMVAEKTAPCMLATASDDLAKLRVNSYILPMVQASDLQHLIVSSDEGNNRKTGKTQKKIEWVGGGWLIAIGTNSSTNLRSASIKNLAADEVDGMKRSAGKDGNTLDLLKDRTTAFEDTRKMLIGSTATVTGQSEIDAQFELGDQCYYYVPCVRCRALQVLIFQKTRETGETWGLVWDEDPDGNLVPGSVRYACEYCGHLHVNDDKSWMLQPRNGAEWRAHATAVSPEIRSFDLPALYSPPGMKSWEACVQEWKAAWDTKHGRPKDLLKLQRFYNNVLGKSFEIQGEKLRFESVSAHRRHAYRLGQVPNQYALEHCGSRILMLCCVVDVQANWLAIGVIGFTRDARSFLIDSIRPEGNTEDLDAEGGPWKQLQQLIETKQYLADDGTVYRIHGTLVDAGYRQETVHRFVSQYQSGVIATRGFKQQGRSARPFWQIPAVCSAWGVSVDFYKERLHTYLRQSWDGIGLQPIGQFNAPLDTTDAQLKELTVEVKTEVVDKFGRRVGVEWRRPSGSRNELWDLLVLATACLEMTAHFTFPPSAERPGIPWGSFWEVAQEGHFYQ